MGMDIPDEVKWLLPIVVGESWPEGDEDKLRELRDAWTAAGHAMPGTAATGGAAAHDVLAGWQGESADAFAQFWEQLTEGDKAQFRQIEQACDQLAESCDRTALDVEYTKYMIIASLIMLAIQVAAMVAAAFATFGATSAGIVPAQLATRAAVQMIFRQLVQKLMQQGVKQVAKEALEKAAKELVQKVSKDGLKSLGGMAAKNAGAQLALDGGIQGVQMASGDRKSWDFGKTTDAGVGGAAEGLAGHLVNGPGHGPGSVVGHAAKGAAEGALGTVAGAAATGDLGALSAKDVLMGASGGAVDGGVGGAKDGFNAAASQGQASVGPVPDLGTDAPTAASEPGGPSVAGPGSGGPADSDGDLGGTGGSAPSSPEAPSAEPEVSPSAQHSGGASTADSSGGGDQAAADRGSTAAGGDPGGSSSGSGGPGAGAGRGDSDAPSATAASAAVATGGPDTAYGSGAPGGGLGGVPGAGQHSGAQGNSPPAAPGAGQPPGAPGMGAMPGGGAAPGGAHGGPVAARGDLGGAGGRGGFPNSPNQGAHSPFAAPDQRGPQQGGGQPDGRGGRGGFPAQQGPQPQAGAPNIGPGSHPGRPNTGAPHQQLPPNAMPGGPVPPNPPAPNNGQPPGGGPNSGGQHGPMRGGPPNSNIAPPAGPNPQHGTAAPPPGPGGGRPPYQPDGGNARNQGPQQVSAQNFAPAQFNTGQPQPGIPGGPAPAQRGGQPTPPNQHGDVGPPAGFPRRGQQAPPPQGARPAGQGLQRGMPRANPNAAPVQGQRGPHQPGAAAPNRQQPPPAFPPNGSPQQPQSAPRGFPRNQQPQSPPHALPQNQPQSAPHAFPQNQQPPQPGSAQPPVTGGRRPADQAVPGNGPANSAPHPAPADPRPTSGRPETSAPRPAREAARTAPDPQQGNRGDLPRTDHNPDQVPRNAEQAPEPQADSARPEAQQPARTDVDPPEAQHAPDLADQAPDDGRRSPATDQPDADADRSTHPEPADPQPEPDTAAAPGHQDDAGDSATPLPPQNLDFCFDPDYRAPAESFAALEEHLANSEAYDDKLRIESNRFDVISRRLAERFHDIEGISARGALAAHSYTTHDVFGPMNEASRLGELTDAKLKHLQAIVSGMNELPREEGPLARGINLSGDKVRRDLIAGHYEVGQITVETALTSFSMTNPDAPNAAVPGDVDLRIESKTARRLQEIASVAGEREAVLLPGSQLLVHSKEMVTELNDKGKLVEKVVIHAEEIAPGDPRYLDRAEVDQRMADRRERARAEVSSKDIDAVLNPPELNKAPEPAPHTEGATEPARSEDRDGSTTDAESGPVATDSRPPQQPPVVEDGAGEAADSPPDPAELSKIENALAGNEPPEAPLAGAQDPPDPDSTDPYDAPPLPVDADGNPAWNQLADSTPPVTERPALHAGTAHPEHQAAYVADRHPELGAVNPDVGQPDAYDRGFLTNCTRCVVGYAQRLAGIDVQAEPVLPGELATKGRLDYIDQRLGGQWESHGSYDSIIDRMSREPIGSHAVIGVQYMNGEVPLGHVAMVTNTPDGVAFIDPQTGRLMTLPHPPRSLTLLPFGSLPQDGVNAGSSRAEPGGQESDSARRAEADSDVRSEQGGPEVRRDSEERREPAEPDEETSGSRRPDGPWFGQHTNPFRPSFPGEEEEDEAALPRVEPISQPPEGIRPPGTSPGTERPDRSAPSAPVPQPAPAGQPNLPATPIAPGPIGSPDMPEPPSSPAAEDVGALNRSFSGTLDSLLPETSHAPAPAAPGMPPPPAENTPSGSSRSAGQGLPASAPSPQDAHAGGAVPGEPGSRPGSAGGGPNSGSGASSGSQGAAGGFPGGGPGAGGAGSGSGSERQPWRAGAASGISYEREQAIPPELALKYLGNHEPSELLAGDGRQSLFRSTSLPDLGPGGFDEFSAGEHAVKLRCEVASGSSSGVLPEQVGLGGGEFTGNAEIVLEDLSGTERVLGTYDSNTQSWTPTPTGRSWMDDPDGTLPGSEQQRRTP